ncbi:hypothetical protein [Staphylococcus equorum]|uniref:hypothetical protein n=1 Tax=Staphylococcus equorum TaxID=246432 RepID=UPI0015D66C6A|nr:hypothetical protein [Staphylococcus equorum]
MRIISCRIKRSNIIYEVESDKGNIFNKSLPKKVTANEARKRLKNASNKVDKK